MNRCFIVGKVINNPEFDFLYMEKRISISYFCLKLNDDNIIKIFGYDENADYIYRNIKSGETVIIADAFLNILFFILHKYKKHCIIQKVKYKEFSLCMESNFDKKL